MGQDAGSDLCFEVSSRDRIAPDCAIRHPVRPIVALQRRMRFSARLVGFCRGRWHQRRARRAEEASFSAFVSNRDFRVPRLRQIGGRALNGPCGSGKEATREAQNRGRDYRSVAALARSGPGAARASFMSIFAQDLDPGLRPGSVTSRFWTVFPCAYGEPESPAVTSPSQARDLKKSARSNRSWQVQNTQSTLDRLFAEHSAACCHGWRESPVHALPPRTRHSYCTARRYRERQGARSGRQECRRWSEAVHGRQRNRPGTTRSPTDVALVPAQPDPSRALAAPRGPRPRCPGTSSIAWSAQPVSPKELRLSKSGSNFSARAGYAAATN